MISDRRDDSFLWNQEILKEGFKIALRDFRINTLGRFFPLKPKSLNLLVNDICNSRCQMCCVWKQKKEREFSPSELDQILDNPLFEQINHIGVSGGEPTLREDLPEIFRVIAKKKNGVLGTSLITNGIQKDQVIERIEKSASICISENRRFNLMVSLDGIGAIHDKIRGRKNNFENALEVIRYFKNNTKIPITIGCTITKNNAWDAEEVFDFCKQEGIKGKFRVGEFINRLYNHQQTEFIRNFSEIEKYNLGLFFFKLERFEQKKSPRRRIYRNIKKMLWNDSIRSTKCHWQCSAVTLNSQGQLLFCAPRSPILGDCLQKPAHKLFIKNIGKRRKIIKNDCDNCIHDYASTETFKEWLEIKREKYWRERFSVNRILLSTSGQKISRQNFKRNISPKNFLIIGWYGTETAGDKAILAEIIFQLNKKYSNPKITLASMFPDYTKWTLHELVIKNVNIIPTFSAELLKKVREADEVIMGGGPLMHMNALGFVYAAFLLANQLGKHTKIFGCGIGPLEKNIEFEEAVIQILNLSDTIDLRDSTSVNWARKKTGRDDIKNIGDPAINFVSRWKQKNPCPSKKSYLNLYLREWSVEYQSNFSLPQFKEIKRKFEINLSEWIRGISNDLNLQPRFLPMHHLSIGRDDREYSRWFSNCYLKDLKPYIEKRPISIDEILKSMQEAQLCVCMRFHSLIFANTLNVPFLAIDYTHGGKISGFVEDLGKQNQMYTLKEIADGKAIITSLK